MMKHVILKGFVVCVFILMWGASAQAQQFAWSNLVGNPGGSGNKDGVGTGARFNYPKSMAVDAAGIVYVADTGNNTIRKLVFTGTTCTVTTLAGTPGITGNADGTGGAAQFNNPGGIAVDTSGNLYVADSGNNTIRKVTNTGVVTTLAGCPGLNGNVDGTGAGAQFGYPQGIAVDNSFNVYVTDSFYHTIRKVTSGGTVTTLAGCPNTWGFTDGTGSGALFYAPAGVAVDASGNLFVADTLNHTIRKVTPGGVVTTLAGTPSQYGSLDGTGTGAQFNFPGALSVDAGGNLYVADTYNHTLRMVTSGGVVTTLSGSTGFIGYSDGAAGAGLFNFPAGVAVDSSGNVYVADSGNHTIRKEAWTVVTTVAGSAFKPALNTQFIQNSTLPYVNYPTGIAVDSGGTVYIASTWNHLILKCTPLGAPSIIAGSTMSNGNADGTSATFNYPGGIAVDSGTNLYVADTHNCTIREISLVGSTWTTTTICGLKASQGNVDGSGTSAMFNDPIGITVDSGTNLYVADTYNSTIRRLSRSGTTWTAATISGSPGVTGTSDGTGSGANYSTPYGIAVDSGSNVYVADSGNATIRMLTLTGSTWSSQTIAGTPGVTGTADGTGAAAQFVFPTMMTVDSGGNLFVTDLGSSTIRMLTNSGSGNWVVTTIGGTPGVNGGGSGPGGIGTQTQFSLPLGIAVLSNGTAAGSDLIYVADSANNRISVGQSMATTGTVTGITKNSAILNGFVDPNGLDTSCYFQYGTTTAYGSTTGTQSIGSGTSLVTVSSTVSGLGTIWGSNELYDYRMVVVNSSGTFYGLNQTFITLPSLVPYFISATSVTGTHGIPFSYTMAAYWVQSRFAANPLPPGLSLNPVTGVISGIPTVTATTNVVLSATNVVGASTVSAAFNIVDLSLPVFSNPGTATGIYGSDFNYIIAASNYTSSYTATGLPAGLTFNSSTELISGTPSTVGTSSITLGAINATGTATMLLALTVTPPYVWTNFAGNPGISGTSNGSGTSAQFYSPQGVAVDSGSNIYVADAYNNTIRMITPSGSVSTFAGLAGTSGTANGTGSNARFHYPYGIAVDSGSNVYVADANNHTIRMITPSGAVSTLAGLAGSSGTANGIGTNARFNNPQGVAVDSGSNVYVADSYSSTIRKITPSGSVSTLAGTGGTSGNADGTGAAARFNYPQGSCIVVDSGSNIYLADTDNNTIRKVTPAGAVTTIAGIPGSSGIMDGPGNIALFRYPTGIAIDSGTNLYIADQSNGIIRKMTLSGTIWMVTTIGGTAGLRGTADGVGSDARFDGPDSIGVASNGNLFVSDWGNQRISRGAVMQPPTITSALTASGTEGVAFNYSIAAGNAPTSFNTNGSAIGLVINSLTGLISGTPTVSGTFALGISASNIAGTGTATLTLSLLPTPYQAWQSLMFTPDQLGNTSISGDTANLAGDGISNLMKYALGMNPNVPYSGTAPQIPYAGATTSGLNQYLTLTFTGTANDVTYSVQATSDLAGTWTTLFSSPPGIAPGIQTVSDTVPMTSATKRFMRLQVSH